MSDTRAVQATPPFVPSAPFDVSSTDADTILRSSDKANFRVHRSILSVVSPFFKDMFSLPQPASEPDIPVIRVSESAVVLDSALRMWYPGAEAAGSETLDVLRAALEASIFKYDMWQFLIPTAKTRLRAHLDTDAVAVFVIACRLKWKDIALEAAKATLKQPLRVYDSSRTPQLSGIGADLYHSLLVYHAQCGVVASSSTSSFQWCEREPGEFPCGSCVGTVTSSCQVRRFFVLANSKHVYTTKWFTTYMAELANILERVPSAQLDSSALMLRAQELTKPQGDTCKSCQRDGLKDVVTFTSMLKARIQQQIDSVQLNLDF